MTIREALDVSDTPLSFREAELFLGHALQVNRAWLHSHGETALTEKQEATYRELVRERQTGKPVAYILGQQEFYSRPFRVDARVLIPRPETEALIDQAVAWGPTYFHHHLKSSNKPCPLRILDLGTGSGAIAITLALELAKRQIFSQIIATDISREALDLAQTNWQQLGKETSTSYPVIHFAEADLFAHQLVTSRQPYHLIVANLPYVPEAWKTDPAAQPEVVDQEPAVALFSGEDGLTLYRRFFKEAPAFLADDGLILLEFGEDQTRTITLLAKQSFPNKTLSVRPDYAGLDRVLVIS